MRAKLAIVLVCIIVVGATAGIVILSSQGFSARAKPSWVEAAIARRVRRLAIPWDARAATNPMPPSAAILADARAHFADHCATCHANDGSGNTDIGRGLYPPAPDMRKADTQSLSDGELFYIIHNGIRFTGMPAWGGEDPAEDNDSWKLVHFIRHLPNMTAAELAEMKQMNPKSQHEMGEEEEIRRFLEGADSDEPKHHH